jgi:hypothetical protein
LPILAQMAAWSVKPLPVSEQLGVKAQLPADGTLNQTLAYPTESSLITPQGLSVDVPVAQPPAKRH